jgi:hypothetical protein
MEIRGWFSEVRVERAFGGMMLAMHECGSLACGDNSAGIGVCVDLDENGAVLSNAVAAGIYMNCL